jgi:hypothetical protein
MKKYYKYLECFESVPKIDIYTDFQNLIILQSQYGGRDRSFFIEIISVYSTEPGSEMKLNPYLLYQCWYKLRSECT